MYPRKKAKKLFLMGHIVIESHSFLARILTEPLNPRDHIHGYLKLLFLHLSAAMHLKKKLFSLSKPLKDLFEGRRRQNLRFRSSYLKRVLVVFLVSFL